MVDQQRERSAKASRETKETQVQIEINLDGKGTADIATGVGFLDHMLTLFAKHGLFDLRVQVKGDLHIDEHHTVEDTAIVLGQVWLRALGDARGVQRVGHCYLPMDETLARVAVDLSGRPFSVFKAEFRNPKVGDLSTDLIWHFFQTFASEARLTLHAEVLYGANDHHRVEALFKALARALSAAVQINPRLAGEVPSTKGMLGFSQAGGETYAPKKD